MTEEGFGITFDAIMWLAIVIVRSCADWHRTLNFPATPPTLGNLESALVQGVYDRRLKFTINPNEAEEKVAISLECGFWLRHGETMSTFMKSFVDRYSRLKDISRALEGQGKWEDSLHFPAALQKFLAEEFD